MKIRNVLAAMGIAVVSGCSSNVDITKTSQGMYDATDPNQVEILMTRPDRPYIELGSVTVTDQPADETAKMHNAIRAKAAPLGADAVVLLQSGIVKNGTIFTSYEQWATGVAIRYKDHAVTPAKK